MRKTVELHPCLCSKVCVLHASGAELVVGWMHFKKTVCFSRYRQGEGMVDQMILHDRIYGGSVASRLAYGHVLFKAYGSTLASQRSVGVALVGMQTKERALADHMQALDLGSLCSRCASLTGGCCSRYMAGETDSLQVLMNLLGGVAVLQVNENLTECCYLGPDGCIFSFKPMFCLNYNCHKIKKLGDGAGYGQLEKLAADLLGSQYELEMHLFRFLFARDSLPEKTGC